MKSKFLNASFIALLTLGLIACNSISKNETTNENPSIDNTSTIVESNSSNQNNSQKEQIQRSEDFKKLEKENQKAYNEVTKKAEAKINALGYTIVKLETMQPNPTEGYYGLNYAVKGGDIGDKIQNIWIDFKKYNEYEIVSLLLVDQINYTKRTLK